MEGGGSLLLFFCCQKCWSSSSQDASWWDVVATGCLVLGWEVGFGCAGPTLLSPQQRHLLLPEPRSIIQCWCSNLVLHESRGGGFVVDVLGCISTSGLCPKTRVMPTGLQGVGASQAAGTTLEGIGGGSGNACSKVGCWAAEGLPEKFGQTVESVEVSNP